MSASIWAPGTAVTASGSIAKQRFEATASQSLFTLTEFTYAVGTGSLAVFVSGIKQCPGVDFTETSVSSFTLDTPVAEGTIVFAEAYTEITSEIPVVDANPATIGASKYVRVNAGATDFEGRSAAQVLSDIGAEPADATILRDSDIGTTIQAYDVDIPVIAASQVEMETGAEAELRSMSPVRVAQAIAALATNTTVQVVEATPVIAVITCSTAIPYDDTIPQSTEGDEVITVTITPTSATNRLRIEFDAGQASINGTGRVISALFQDSAASALAATSESFGGVTYDSFSLRLSHEMAAGTTSATTFKIRVGATSGSVAYINASGAGARIFGGVAAARIRVTELKL